MSYNPKKGIAYFEAGCIQCEACGMKPDDPWDDKPKGFKYVEGEWLCEECEKDEKKAIV